MSRIERTWGEFDRPPFRAAVDFASARKGGGSAACGVVGREAGNAV
jgi:hypothetical protein